MRINVYHRPYKKRSEEIEQEHGLCFIHLMHSKVLKYTEGVY